MIQELDLLEDRSSKGQDFVAGKGRLNNSLLSIFRRNAISQT